MGLGPAGLLGCSLDSCLCCLGHIFTTVSLGKMKQELLWGSSHLSPGRDKERTGWGGSSVSSQLSSWAGLPERGSVLPRGWCTLTTLWFSGKRNHQESPTTLRSQTLPAAGTLL